jgi:hypothetical protein
MSKQYNKAEKRKRRNRYLTRKKDVGASRSERLAGSTAMTQKQFIIAACVAVLFFIVSCLGPGGTPPPGIRKPPLSLKRLLIWLVSVAALLVLMKILGI